MEREVRGTSWLQVWRRDRFLLGVAVGCLRRPAFVFGEVFDPFLEVVVAEFDFDPVFFPLLAFRPAEFEGERREPALPGPFGVLFFTEPVLDRLDDRFFLVALGALALFVVLGGIPRLGVDAERQGQRAGVITNSVFTENSQRISPGAYLLERTRVPTTSPLLIVRVLLPASREETRAATTWLGPREFLTKGSPISSTPCSRPTWEEDTVAPRVW